MHLDNLEESEDEEIGSEDDEENDQPASRSSTSIPYDPLIDIITDDEWAEIERLSSFLIHFYEMTRRLEGNQSKSTFGSLWQTSTNLQHLDDVLCEMIKETANDLKDSYLRSAVRFGLKTRTTY